MLDKAVENAAPFFMVVSFTAPHWPLHARRALLDAYRGRFYMGWDELRAKRYQRMIDMGIIHRYWKLSPRDPRVLSWFDVPFKDWHQRRMEAYAAQVESMDQAWKILEKVKHLGEQNTLVSPSPTRAPAAKKSFVRAPRFPEDVEGVAVRSAMIR
jgi:arylsulfatase